MALEPRKPPDSSYRATSNESEKVVKDLFSEELDGEIDHEKKAKKSNIIIPKRRVVTLDDRKLTKKDASKLLNWKGQNKGKALDAFFRRQVEGARKKYGHKSVYIGSELDALILAIPMFGGHGNDAAKFPGCLPMEFVLAQDGFPLGLVMQLVGKQGCCKTGLLAEIGRWFHLADGGMNLCDTEDKFNKKWWAAIQGDECTEMMPMYACKSVEDWQRKLTYAIQSTQLQMEGTKDDLGPGRTFPVLFGVDSIMGRQSEETQEQILGKRDKRTGKRGSTGKGHAERGFPIEALIITRYMRTIPGIIDNWPFALVLVNHLRISKDEMGNTERSKAGGEQVNFQESFELELKKVGGHKKRLQSKAFDGIPLQISCEKNSFGPTHRSIQTRILWWDEEDEHGDWKQKTVWDWDWSTIHLLENLMHGENTNPRIKESLKDIDFHLECPTRSDIENTAWSKTLGMTKSDAMSWSEVGALIRENPKLMDQLRKALRINNRPLLDGDYLDQLDTMSEELP